MRTIKEITKDELFEIADLITAGYFSDDWSREKKEVETGGYGKRRRVEWVMNTEGYDEFHCMEVSAESKNLSWSFSCKAGVEMDSVTKKPRYENHVNICNIAKVVDYCRSKNIDIDNKN